MRSLIGRSASRWLLAGALGLALALPRPVAAQGVLYDQPSDFPNVNASWTITFNQFSSGFNAMDNFTLGLTSTITEIRWQAFYWDFQTPANNPVTPPPALSFGLAFLNSLSPGVPDAYIGFTNLVVTSEFIGTTSFGQDTVPVYEFSGALNTPFVAQGGVEYWASPFVTQEEFNPLLSWIGSANTGGVSYQDQFQGGFPTARFERPGDRVFTLTGSVAPEPSALALCLLGGAAALAARLRRR